MMFSKKGVTLIEMIVVVAIIGMILGMSGLMFKFFTAGSKLKAAARNISTALHTARSYAIVKRAVYKVNFDTVNAQFGVYASDDTVNMDKLFKLPDGVVFDSGPTSISFKADGATTDTGISSIVIKNIVDSQTSTVWIYSATGAVRCED